MVFGIVTRDGSREVLEDIISGVGVEAQLTVGGVGQNALLLVVGGAETVDDVLRGARERGRCSRGNAGLIELVPIVYVVVFIGIALEVDCVRAIEVCTPAVALALNGSVLSSGLLAFEAQAIRLLPVSVVVDAVEREVLVHLHAHGLAATT